MALPTTPVPHIGFGQVWHTRLRPRRHRFAYRVFFLLLPMRTLQAQPQAGGVLAYNRRGALSFHDADHGDGRSPAAGGRSPGSMRCWLLRASTTPAARSGCSALRASWATPSSP